MAILSVFLKDLKKYDKNVSKCFSNFTQDRLELKILRGVRLPDGRRFYTAQCGIPTL